MVTPRLAAVAVAIAVALAVPGRAAAADPPEVGMTFIERGSSLFVKTSVTSVLDLAAYNRLENGLPSTIVIRIWLYPKGSKRPVTFQLLHRQVVYDLWDEVYQVALSGPRGRRVYTVKFKADALKLMTEIDPIWVSELIGIAHDTEYYVAVVAELNPVSAQTLAEVRRWLSDGAGNGLDRGGSFFGSFVSVFVNFKVPEADRVIRMRSQSFVRARPPA